MNTPFIQEIPETLLDWYDEHARILPWRLNPSCGSDLYAVVVSEMMLQQTTVTTVIPYFKKFLARWPTFEALAKASIDEVLHEWQGLGYYRRARSLWESAQILAHTLPENDKEWQALPGFGPYTCAAVRSIVYQEPVIALDGNIKRIMSRFFREPEDKKLSSLAQSFAHPQRSGDVNQALMDLGSSICTPLTPHCLRCPLQTHCQAFLHQETHLFPLKKAKIPKPIRYGYAYCCVQDRHLALEKREGQGLLKGGLMGVPLSDFLEIKPQDFAPQVRHTFTHFHLQLQLEDVSPHSFQGPIQWIPLENLDQYPLPTLMKKVIQKFILY